MPNVNQPNGLSPVRYRSGAPWNGAAHVYAILAADTNGYWIGDPVTTIGNGGGDAGGVPSVTLASAGAASRGVIIGLGLFKGGPFLNPDNLSVMKRPAAAQSVDWYALVVDDPDVLFEIQEAGVGAALTTAAVNRNVNFNTGTRTASLNMSPTFLDNNTVNTNATLNLKIHQLVQRVDNAFGAYAKWLVSLNSHEFSAGTTSP